MTIQLQRGTSNAKLTGGGKRNDVWTASPHADGDAYATCPTTCRLLPNAAYDSAVGAGLPVDPDRTGGCYTAGRVAAAALRFGDALDGIDALVKEAEDAGDALTLLRYGVVGDYGRTADERAATIDGLLRIKGSTAVITYTHAWRTIGTAPDASMNASCDRVSDIDEARALGWQPTIVGPSDNDEAHAFARSVRGVVCPAADERSPVKGCVDCGNGVPLCARDRRGATVVFPAHGAGKRTLDRALA